MSGGNETVPALVRQPLHDEDASCCWLELGLGVEMTQGESEERAYLVPRTATNEDTSVLWQRERLGQCLCAREAGELHQLPSISISSKA